MDVLAVALMRLLNRGVDRLDRQLLGEVEGYGDMSCLTVLAQADLESVQKGPPQRTDTMMDHTDRQHSSLDVQLTEQTIQDASEIRSIV